jgi:class 3 adenylate cyclase
LAQKRFVNNCVLEFTLIGDTVNVAARVERLTKITDDAILLPQPHRPGHPRPEG